MLRFSAISISLFSIITFLSINFSFSEEFEEYSFSVEIEELEGTNVILEECTDEINTSESSPVKFEDEQIDEVDEICVLFPDMAGCRQPSDEESEDAPREREPEDEVEKAEEVVFVQVNPSDIIEEEKPILKEKNDSNFTFYALCLIGMFAILLIAVVIMKKRRRRSVNGHQVVKARVEKKIQLKKNSNVVSTSREAPEHTLCDEEGKTDLVLSHAKSNILRQIEWINEKVKEKEEEREALSESKIEEGEKNRKVNALGEEIQDLLSQSHAYTIKFREMIQSVSDIKKTEQGDIESSIIHQSRIFKAYWDVQDSFRNRIIRDACIALLIQFTIFLVIILFDEHTTVTISGPGLQSGWRCFFRGSCWTLVPYYSLPAYKLCFVTLALFVLTGISRFFRFPLLGQMADLVAISACVYTTIQVLDAVKFYFGMYKIVLFSFILGELLLGGALYWYTHSAAAATTSSSSGGGSKYNRTMWTMTTYLWIMVCCVYPLYLWFFFEDHLQKLFA